MSHAIFFRWGGAPRFFLITTLLVLSTALLVAQPKYRTFNQSDLALKKAKAGKAVGSTACFTFKNDSTGITVNSLHARFNSEIETIIDSGGFTTLAISHKGKVLDATGRTVAAGDSVTICLRLEKKAPGAQANFWWWDTNGVPVPADSFRRAELAGIPDSIIRRQPNGGNVRDFIYKHVITRPNGLIVGIVATDTPNVHWIQYMTADRKYFPHTDSARCFGDGFPSPGRPLKNPHVKKFNDNLLGEVHALKLAIIANDSGVTQPDTPAVRLGDLIYNDSGNPSDPCNNLSLRAITHLVDSALTYCTHFVSSSYAPLDTCVTRINRAFDGPYVAVSFSPFELAGTNPLPSFLHNPPSAAPVTVHRLNYSIIDDVPARFTVYQNYPNPFNPTTKIDFNLPTSSLVTLKIYNILGQEVATLFNNEQMDEGDQSVEFDASKLSSGVYFYRLSAQGTDDAGQQFQTIKRMVLIK